MSRVNKVLAYVLVLPFVFVVSFFKSTASITGAWPSPSRRARNRTWSAASSPLI